MFKGLSGLKKAVKGGFSAVAEHSSNLAEQVVSDPSTSQGHLKESLKEKVKGFNATVTDVGENVLANSEGAAGSKEKATEVVHSIKHYGGFGEEYLGYSDPTKDLRKAVKQKEKAAKKARKEKKKKTGKKGEDLFDPENLAKYKREIEEKRRQAEEAAAAATEHSHSDNSPGAEEAGAAGAVGGGEEERQYGEDSDDGDNKQHLSLALATHEDQQQHSRQASAANTPSGRSPAVEKKENSDDWRLFQSLTSGVDNLIQKTSTDLKEIKEESYFQQKEVKVVDKTHAGIERKKLEEQQKAKGKNWVDLDSGSFEDFDGAVEDFGDDKKEVDVGLVLEEDSEKDLDKPSEDNKEEKTAEEENKEEEKPELFKEPSIDDFDADEDEDIFNTDFVTAVTTGEVKLAVIPDSPTYDDDEDDPFNTAIADVIVKKDKEEKKKEQTKLKFTGLSAVADVLAGKTDKLDKSQLEHQVKKKRRRANRINLIADEADDVTGVEELAEDLAPDTAPEQQLDILGDLGNTSANSGLGVPTTDDLLATTPTSQTSASGDKTDSEDKKKVDFSEFEDILGLGGESKDTKTDLTSNIAILAGEFATAAEEEEDDFDAAFDALAHESVTKTRLEELEKQFENDDIFDTSNADKVLQLASLIDKVDEKQEEPELVFEDPFDTSAYDNITGEVETELEFDSLISREAAPSGKDSAPVVTGEGSDVFFSGASAQAQNSEGWAAFVDKSKPPPRPAPPAPRRPPPPRVQVHPDDRPQAPSVVIKAPSTESIKSWNNSVADQLIRKSVSDALLEEEQEEEDDPFDTKGYEGIAGIPEDPFDTSKIGQEGKADKEEDKQEDLEDCEDPFDTTAVDGVIEKSHETERALEKARQPLDLLTEDGEQAEDAEAVTLQPVSKDVHNPEVDPFDTEFAAEVLPDKGDPFDTTHVKGELGKAEIKALEEEFLDHDEFDPRTTEGTAIPKRNLPGIAGRARPKRAGTGELKIKTASQEEEEEDPFDTSIVDKVIPLRKAKKSAELSVEDDDFDPTSTFLKSKEVVTVASVEEEEEVDPFDTCFATSALPEEERKIEEEKQRQEALKKQQEEEERERQRTIAEAAERLKKRQQGKQPSPDISDDDFDPRAF